MTVIVLFGGPSDERHVSVASAQNIVRALGSPLCWFWAPNGPVHDVAVNDLHRPLERHRIRKGPHCGPRKMLITKLPLLDLNHRPSD